MELMDAIKGRRSVRNFTGAPVAKSVVMEIMKVMDYCPNAGNRNYTRAAVITDPGIISYIGKAHTLVRQNFNRGIETSFSDAEINAAENAFHNAPSVIALFGPKNFYFSQADAYIMAYSITLAAYERGVSTCIVGEVLNSLASEKGRLIQKEIGIPYDFVPQVYVTMGYCGGEYPAHPPRRYSDIIFR